MKKSEIAFMLADVFQQGIVDLQDEIQSLRHLLNRTQQELTRATEENIVLEAKSKRELLMPKVGNLAATNLIIMDSVNEEQESLRKDHENELKKFNDRVASILAKKMPTKFERKLGYQLNDVIEWIGEKASCSNATKKRVKDAMKSLGYHELRISKKNRRRVWVKGELLWINLHSI